MTESRLLRYRVQRLVRARPEVLWELITDPHQAVVAQRAVKRVEVFTAGPVGPGTRYRQFARALGLPVAVDVEVEDFEPFHRVTARVHYPADGTRSWDEFLLEPVDGGTLVTSGSWVLGAGRVRRVLLAVARPVDLRTVRRALARLAEVAESRAAGA
ncbi:SRPBCC family protein [Actinosynnema sp. NPDC023658]|uniref:SRPBCC family protein n=1 Tax=Actinosynnema sp. NPDC023658 TaxID=3155465 RepID=UPI0033C2A30F